MTIRKRGQVWVETVLYTLIGLALIGLVLGFVTPRINEAKDKLAVEQTISSLNNLDERISSVLETPGNKRQVDFTMKRGEMYIDGAKDQIRFLLSDLNKPYSEVGVPIDIGRVKIISKAGQKSNSVELTLNYTGTFNLTYSDKGVLKDVEKKFTQAATPYTLSVENHGDLNNNGFFVVSIGAI